MSKQAIVERILSDAGEEAKALIAAAEQKAEAAVAEAQSRAERNKKGAQAEADAKAKSILDGKAATARLDCAKLLLADKRRVIDGVYARALGELNSLPQAQALRLAENLLKDYAEYGDEIKFAENYKYAREVAALSTVGEKKLKISSEKAEIDGGFVLVGKNSDKDLSYASLLALDREQFEPQIASSLFKD